MSATGHQRRRRNAKLKAMEDAAGKLDGVETLEVAADGQWRTGEPINPDADQVTENEKQDSHADDQNETDTNTPEEQNDAEDEQQDGYEPLNDPIGSLVVGDVDSLRIEEVKKHLDAMEIKYAHNTGEEKLRERLKDAVSGS